MTLQLGQKSEFNEDQLIQIPGTGHVERDWEEDLDVGRED